MPLQQIILLFFIYACLGWGCEVAFAAWKHGRFVNRGFLNGPICPIYGFGVVGVVLALKPIQDNIALLCLGSVLLTTAIEYVTGWALQKLFHARWWDYSNMPLNINGYVCLLFSLIWGAACVIIVEWIHPLFAAGVAMLPFWLCITLDALFGATFITDLCATVSAVRKLSDRLTRLTEAAAELHAISDEIGQGIYETTTRAVGEAETIQAKGAQAKARIEEQQGRVEVWLAQHRAEASANVEGIRARFEGVRTRVNQALSEHGFGHRRLLDAFPNLRSERHQDALETLRRFYDRRNKA